MSFGMRFPSIEAADLEGRWYALPDDLPTGPRALVVGFQHMHGPRMREWATRLEELQAEYPRLTVWQVAPLSDGYRVMRDFILGGMRGRMTEPGLRQRFLVSYTDLRLFSETLALRTMDAVYALLLDHRGFVYWRTDSQADDAQIDVARRTLAKISET